MEEAFNQQLLPAFYNVLPVLIILSFGLLCAVTYRVSAHIDFIANLSYAVPFILFPLGMGTLILGCVDISQSSHSPIENMLKSNDTESYRLNVIAKAMEMEKITPGVFTKRNDSKQRLPPYVDGLVIGLGAATFICSLIIFGIRHDYNRL